MRHIQQIYTALPGERWDNQRLLAAYELLIEKLPAKQEEREKLRDFVRFQLVGERSRRFVAGALDLEDFSQRATAYQKGLEQAVGDLATQILETANGSGVIFDAVIGTSSTGALMPGMTYRIANRLKPLVREDSLMIDLGSIGCSGGIVALNVALAMEERYRNILTVAYEAPSTLQNTKTTAVDAWQGNCTFGDGAAAVWISSGEHPRGLGLAIEKLRNWQHSATGLDLIHSRYDDYYGFAMRDEKTFDEDVKQFVTGALSATESEWRDEPRWAIHPAGIVLLTRISRKLGIPRDALQASVDNYRANSNMSSVSILHILKAVAEETPPGAAVNLLTMGAGFNVIYGKVRRSN